MCTQMELPGVVAPPAPDLDLADQIAAAMQREDFFDEVVAGAEVAAVPLLRDLRVLIGPSVARARNGPRTVVNLMRRVAALLQAEDFMQICICKPLGHPQVDHIAPFLSGFGRDNPPHRVGNTVGRHLVRLLAREEGVPDQVRRPMVQPIAP
jgi:hypothetical protein